MPKDHGKNKITWPGEGSPHTENGILARIAGGILRKLGMNTILLDRRLEELANRASRSSDRVERKVTKSTLYKKYIVKEMTWKTFISLLYNVVNPLEVEFIVRVKTRKKTIEHSYKLINPEGDKGSIVDEDKNE